MAPVMTKTFSVILNASTVTRNVMRRRLPKELHVSEVSAVALLDYHLVGGSDCPKLSQ